MVKADIREFIGVKKELLFLVKERVKEENHLEQDITVLHVKQAIIQQDVWLAVIGDYYGRRKKKICYF
jgi:hypothetical protein